MPLFQSESKRETILMSRGAFCLRMLRREYFDVSNRWYAPTLRGRKSQNGGGCNKVFGGVSLRSHKINQMVSGSLVESPNQVRSEGQA